MMACFVSFLARVEEVTLIGNHPISHVKHSTDVKGGKSRHHHSEFISCFQTGRFMENSETLR